MIDEETIALKLIEIANFMSPNLMYVPLYVESIGYSTAKIESPIVENLNSMTVSAVVSNGEKDTEVTISFLVNTEEIKGATV